MTWESLKKMTKQVITEEVERDAFDKDNLYDIIDPIVPVYNSDIVEVANSDFNRFYLVDVGDISLAEPASIINLLRWRILEELEEFANGFVNQLKV